MTKKTFITFSMIIAFCLITINSFAGQGIGFRGVNLGSSPYSLAMAFGDENVTRISDTQYYVGNVDDPYFVVDVDDSGSIVGIASTFTTFNLQGTPLAKFVKILVDNVDWIDSMNYHWNGVQDVYQKQDNVRGFILLVSDNRVLLCTTEKTGKPVF